MIRKIRGRIQGNKDFMNVAKGSGLTFGLKIVGMAINYTLIWIMARSMGTDAVGTFMLMISLCNIISIFAKLGFGNAILKFITQARIKGKNIYSNLIFLKVTIIILSINGIIGIALYFLSPVIAVKIFNKPFLEPFIRLSAFSIFPMAFTHIAAAYLRGYKKIWQYTFLQDIGNDFFGLVFLISLLSLWPSEMLPVSSWVFGWCVMLLFSVYMLARMPHTRMLKFRGWSTVRSWPLLKVSIPMMMTSTFVFLLNWTDTFMVGIYKSTSEVGIYSSASKVAAFTTIMISANAVIAGPKIVAYFTEGQMDNLKKLLTHSSFLISIFAIPVAILMMIFPTFILGLFGEDFKEGKWVLIILSFAQIVNSTTGLVGLALNMTGREVLMQNLMIATVVMNIILNMVLIPPYGIEGAAIATCISLIFKNLSSFYFVKKHLGFYSVSLDFIRDKLNSYRKRK